jgi:hypothetical protein
MASEALDLVVAERLSKTEQADFRRLFSSDNSRQIMSQNSISIAEPLPGSYSGPHNVLCLDISRINHRRVENWEYSFCSTHPVASRSCTPNVEWNRDASSSTISINTRISKGEELFCPYQNFRAPRSERLTRGPQTSSCITTGKTSYKHLCRLNQHLLSHLLIP